MLKKQAIESSGTNRHIVKDLAVIFGRSEQTQ
jgi:hypothetical protein